jgi:hypothetical protein
MELLAGVLIGALLFAWTVWAVLLWGSIAIVERHNPFNTFGWALAWSGLNMVVSLANGALGIAGLGVRIIWLVFLMRLLLHRYELGFLHSLGVVIVTVVGPYFVGDAFISFVGSSASLFLIVLYAVPVVILVAWKRPRPAPQLPSNLPAARVTRLFRKRAPTAPVTVAAPPLTPAGPFTALSVASPAPPPRPAAPAPVVAAPAPVVAAAPPPVVVPPIAPPAPPEPRADGEPTFLR